MAILGRAGGRRLHALAHNRDPRPVRTGRSRRSFGSQSARNFSTSSPSAVEAVLAALVDRVTRRMRAKKRIGRTVILRMRFADFSRASRSRTLARPTADTRPILTAGRALLADARPTIRERGLTLVGITVTNLDGGGSGAQLELPVDGPAEAALDRALDEVRDRFGSTAVTRAALLGKDRRLSASLLPE